MRQLIIDACIIKRDILPFIEILIRVLNDAYGSVFHICVSVLYICISIGSKALEANVALPVSE